jgi:hypothetical protein
MAVIGWKLDEIERAELLERFPPHWPDVIADHVTLDAEVPEDHALPTETAGAIMGGIDDGEGLQAMVVAISGTTDRPDGSTYHITWSLDRARGRRAVESKKVIVERGYAPLDDPVPIRLVPARL